MPQPKPAAWGYRPGLDGLRTVAVYLVVLFHAGLTHMANGFIGVDVFFVLSGFLVTNVMINEHRETGGLRLGRFYARRIRRLLPAAVVLVASVSALNTLVQPRLTRISYIGDARSALLYGANWHFLAAATDYFAHDVNRSPFLHFWSLAIEEQFYVAFPLILLGLLALAGRWRDWRVVPLGLGAVLLASLTAQVLFAGSDPLRAYYGTDTRLYQLMTGALLAAAWQRAELVGGEVASTSMIARARLAGSAAAAGVTALVLASTDLIHMPVSARGMIAAVAAVVVVAALELSPGSHVGRLLSRPTCTYLGRISYGTYLWHWPLIVLLRVVFTISPLELAVLAGVGATALSALSFHLLETPIRRTVRFVDRPKAAVAIGLTCSVVVAALLVPAILRSERRPTLAAEGIASTAGVDASPGSAEDSAVLARALAAVPPADLGLAATEPPPYDLRSCRADSPDSCILHRGTGIHVHLIGDSNALVLIPMFEALAQQHDFTFSASAAVGCPWQDGLAWGTQDKKLVTTCIADRQGWYDRVIPALHPDLVIAVNVPRDPGSRSDAFFQAVDPATDHRSFTDVVAAATDASLDRLAALGARVVLFEPLPYDNVDPTECVSGAATVGACAYRSDISLFPTEALYRHEAQRRHAVFDIDADRLACPLLPVCVPMIDGELVFRNQFHLSNKWLLDHSAAWWNLIVSSGALNGLTVSR